MSERLKGQFCGCPYHDDDYEACIQYSGQAPCDPPDGWRLVPVKWSEGMAARLSEKIGKADALQVWAHWKDALAAAPRPGGGDES